MKLFSVLLLSLGLITFCASGYVNVRGQNRNIQEDGYQPQQSITASLLGFERDVVCVWGDDFERSIEECKTCDDGRVHNHWMCDLEKVVLRPNTGVTPSTTTMAAAYQIGPGTEGLVSFAMCLLGFIGFSATRDRY